MTLRLAPVEAGRDVLFVTMLDRRDENALAAVFANALPGPSGR